MMSVLSWSGGFGRGHEAQIFFFLCGKEVPPQNLPRVSPGEILWIGESKGRSRRRPFAPLPRSGFDSRMSAIVKAVNDGGSQGPDVGWRMFMVGMSDRR